MLGYNTNFRQSMFGLNDVTLNSISTNLLTAAVAQIDDLTVNNSVVFPPGFKTKFTWLGTYGDATQYEIDDVVYYNGSSYVCVLDSLGNLPSNFTYFNLMTEKGADGVDGIDGVGFTFQNAFNIAVNYILNDVVSYNGSSYLCISDSIGNLPINSVYFSLIAQKGDNGTSIIFKNTFDNDTNYVLNDVVYFNGSSYICILNSVSHAPTNATYWSLIAQKGNVGATGATGASGMSFTFIGNYSGSTTYLINDVVFYNGSCYICKLVSAGNAPTNTTYWSLMAQKGDPGTNGSNGSNGSDGEDGRDGDDGNDGADGDATAANAAAAAAVISAAACVVSAGAAATSAGAAASSASAAASSASSAATSASNAASDAAECLEKTQNMESTPGTTNFVDRINVQNTSLANKVILKGSDGSVEADQIYSRGGLVADGAAQIGSSSTNTDTTNIHSNAINIGTSNCSTLNIGSALGSPFLDVNIKGLTIDLFGIVTINGVPFWNVPIRN